MPRIPNGRLLRETRDEMGLTLRQVQEETGISESTLRNLEHGRNTNPKLEILDLLADYYGFQRVSDILMVVDRDGKSGNTKKPNRKKPPARKKSRRT